MRDQARILVVDDEPALRDLYADILEGEGWRTDAAATLREGLALFDRELYDVVLTDLRLPDGEGTDLLRHVRAHDPEVEVVLITAYGTVQSAVEAMKLGAADYLTKPLADPDALRRTLRGAIDRARARRDEGRLRSEIVGDAAADLLTFASPGMAEAVRLAEAVAPTGATVLILGESGTGKEVLARFLHRLHPGPTRPFVAVNCAAIPEALLESELFGHERGAFTGAVERRVGRFEQAIGGTLFLDEIGDLRPDLQAKLLRVLQERTFERVGGTRPIATDARVLAATNRDLQGDVRSGRFRDDLYYRLAVFPIRLPPLRERRDDLLPLAELFLRRSAAAYRRPARRFEPEARDRLLAHGWPGNVRELQNVVERAVILEPGEAIRSAAIRFADGPSASVASGGEGVLERLERDAIQRVLEQVDGNRRRAARVLGISLRTLQYRLKGYQGEP
jgi:two-component system response regulator FlrC